MINQTLLLAGDDAYNLTKSLRFRSSASAYLNRTPSSTGNRKTWTYSTWVKRGKLGAFSDLYTANDGTGGSNLDSFEFNSSDVIRVYFEGAISAYLVTTQVFRDPSAWYHLVLAVDTTQATSSNRIKLYVNGVQVTAFSTATYPSQNYDTYFNLSGRSTVIGASAQTSPSGFFDGYQAETNFIDGQALTPTSFGSFNALTGVWQPAKYTGTYGTNGFYLPFTDVATTSGSNAGLGKDFSGNGNYWTTNNISITAGITYDSMNDVPTLTSATQANYCVLNPLDQYSNVTLSNANLSATFSAYTGFVRGTMALPSTGKWYWEGTVPTSDVRAEFGIATFSQALGVDPQSAAGCWFYYSNGTNTYKYSAGTATLWGSAWVSGDIIGIAFDADAGTLSYYINGTLQGGGVATTGLTGTYAPMVGFGNNTSTAISVNFGQRPFAYTPPTGFVALNTFNLPEPSIKAGNKHFNAVTWTGNGTSSGRSITGVGFQPDFVWGKPRSLAYSHSLSDSVRGANKRLSSGTTGSEDTNFTYGYTSSFDADGFTTSAGATDNENWNTTGESFVAWNWKAGNSAGSSNTAGSITSTVSANPTAGFSVVTYAGLNAGVTIGHGLGIAPSMVIFKNRTNGTTNWRTYHTSLGTANYLNLNTTAASANDSGWFGASSSTLNLNGGNDYCATGFNYVAYCWAEIAGFSKFTSYTGNGSSDGSFVYCGFRPKFLMVKNATAANVWLMLDAARNTYNVVTLNLNANHSAADNSNTWVDFVSNGFKVRNATDGAINTSGDNYIYMAFAESPFKTSLAR